MKYHNILKTSQDYQTLKEATQISVRILKEIRDNVKIGVTAGHLNELAENLCAQNEVRAAFKGVPGNVSPFPSSVCVSVNNVVLHGIPHEEIIFKDGDIVKVDFGIIYNGFYTDHCVTVGLGKLTEREQQLISTAKLCIDTAVKNATQGNFISDISRAMQTVAELADFRYVTSYCGHGIGKKLWLAPEVPAYLSPFREEVELVEGMVLCIENQLTTGSAELKTDKDGWSLKTVDGSKGAMFEHMVIVRKDEPEILTLLD